jgi:hypothetical protein
MRLRYSCFVNKYQLKKVKKKLFFHLTYFFFIRNWGHHQNLLSASKSIIN